MLATRSFASQTYSSYFNFWVDCRTIVTINSRCRFGIRVISLETDVEIQAIMKGQWRVKDCVGWS